MVGTMTAFLYDMVEDVFDRLDDIMIYKYPKFIKCYWILKRYSEDISKVKYDDDDDDSLTITVYAEKKKTIVAIAEDLDDYEDSEYSIVYNANVDDKVITISMHR